MRVETAAEACIRTGIPQGTVTNYERRAEVAIFRQRNAKVRKGSNETENWNWAKGG